MRIITWRKYNDVVCESVRKCVNGHLICVCFGRLVPTDIAMVPAILEETAKAISKKEAPSFVGIGPLAQPANFTVGNYASLFHLPPKYVKKLADIWFGEGKGGKAYVKSRRINSLLYEREMKRAKQQHCVKAVEEWKRMPAFGRMPQAPKSKGKCDCCSPKYVVHNLCLIIVILFILHILLIPSIDLMLATRITVCLSGPQHLQVPQPPPTLRPLFVLPLTLMLVHPPLLHIICVVVQAAEE